jgi:hypothetical protein
MTILEMIRGARKREAASMQDLAKRVAAGEAVDPMLIVDTVSRAGATDAEFLELTDIFERRADLRRKAAGYEPAEREIKTLRDRIEREAAVLNEAKRRYNAVVEPLEESIRVTEGRLMDALSARNQLGADRNIPRPIVLRRSDAKIKLETAVREHTRAHAAWKIAADWIASDEKNLAAFNGGPEAAIAAYEKGTLSDANGDGKAAKRLHHYRGEARRLRPFVDQAAEAVAEAKAAVDAIEQEIASL